MTHRRRTAVCLVAVILSLLLAGCGASGSGAAGSGAAESRAQRVQNDGAGSAVALELAATEIFEEHWLGAPVLGAAVSALPYLAPLDSEANRTHHVRIDSLAADIEISPGICHTAWTYGGSVPGPVLHVRQGDTVEWVSRNRSHEATDAVALLGAQRDGSPYARIYADIDPFAALPAVAPLAHSIDIHAATVAPDRSWLSTAPGESFRLRWTAHDPGVFLYHSAMPSRLMHLGMGLHGTVIVAPSDGYPTDHLVDRSYVLVRREHYLMPFVDTDAINASNDPSAPAERYVWDHRAALAAQPLLVTLNGAENALHSRPLVANAHERVRLYVANHGPNLTATFSVTGIVFERVWTGGVPHNELRGLSQVTIEPGAGAVVEFVAPAEGEYTFLYGRLTDAEQSASGTLVVGPGRES